MLRVHSFLMDNVLPGLVGGALATPVMYFWGRKFSTRPCPRCHQPIGPRNGKPRTRQQRIYGGATCSACGCDVNVFGRARSSF